jgi:hypothetical protein
MKSKQGALSYYMIAGIIILLASTFLIFTNSSLMEGFVKLLSIDTKPSHNYVETCITDKAKAGLKILAVQGAIIKQPVVFLNDHETKIKYYSNSTPFPDLKEVEEEYEAYVTEAVPGCIMGYNNISVNKLALNSYSIDVFFGIDQTHIEVRNVFNQKETSVKKKAPDISIEIPVRYMMIHKIAAAIKESRSDTLQTKYIPELKSFEGINVTWTRLDGYDLYLIEDSKSNINKETYRFTLLIG